MTQKLSQEIKILRRTQFGNPVLRQVARQLDTAEIRSEAVQTLIQNMYYTLERKKYGIGLAAPQVGESLALSAILVMPMPWRPTVEEVKLTIINPKVIETYGRRTGMWEGCISFCGEQKEFPYAKALRWRKVRVKYQDERGEWHEKKFDGLLAHVLQHEIDHLNGILFVDRVRDPKTYVTVGEYIKRYRNKRE